MDTSSHLSTEPEQDGAGARTRLHHGGKVSLLKVEAGAGHVGIVEEMAKGRAGMVPRMLNLAMGRLTKV